MVVCNHQLAWGFSQSTLVNHGNYIENIIQKIIKCLIPLRKTKGEIIQCVCRSFPCNYNGKLSLKMHHERIINVVSESFRPVL